MNKMFGFNLIGNKMKHIFWLLMVFLMTINLSCKKGTSVKMTVVRDCTGTYLRKGGKDYHVCNLEKVTLFNDGQDVIVNYKKLKKCNGSGNDMIVCLMFHENEGWVEVTEIE